MYFDTLLFCFINVLREALRCYNVESSLVQTTSNTFSKFVLKRGKKPPATYFLNLCSDVGEATCHKFSKFVLRRVKKPPVFLQAFSIPYLHNIPIVNYFG